MGRFDDMKRELKMRQVMAKGGDVEAAQQEFDQATSDKANKTLAKVGLDLDNTPPSTIKRLNAESVNKIRSEMAGNGLLKAGLTFGGSVTERATLGYFSALTEQNWIMIRQNELIIRYLEQGNKK